MHTYVFKRSCPNDSCNEPTGLSPSLTTCEFLARSCRAPTRPRRHPVRQRGMQRARGLGGAGRHGEARVAEYTTQIGLLSYYDKRCSRRALAVNAASVRLDRSRCVRSLSHRVWRFYRAPPPCVLHSASVTRLRPTDDFHRPTRLPPSICGRWPSGCSSGKCGQRVRLRRRHER